MTTRTSTARKWRNFADREFPVVVRELNLPCARPTGIKRCFRHEAVGPVTRICLPCHTEAWAEVAHRYLAAG